MSDRTLYHVWRIRGYEVKHCERVEPERLVVTIAKMLASRRSSLLAWYDYPISTGPLEAVINKIKLLSRQAFGYRNRQFFELTLFALHNARYALVG